MKIIEKLSSDKFLEANDYRSFYEINIDGKQVFSFFDGEPEDANLLRDFSDCYNIVDALKAAYEAGKNGEPFDIEKIELDDFE